MKQQELIGAILIGLFVAIAGLVAINTFIASPDQRQEDVAQVRSIDSGFSDEAREYLNEDSTLIYTVDGNIEANLGSGNKQPFSSGQ